MRIFQAVVFCTLLLCGCGPQAEIASPHFRFENYSGNDSLNALQQQFPSGTPRSVVEEKLLTEGGARAITLPPRSQPEMTFAELEKLRGSQRILYRYDRTDMFLTYGYSVIATYDANNNVLNISAEGGKVAPGRVDPKVSPEKFDAAAWLSFPSGELELDDLLKNDFPAGTSRGEFENAILASHQLSPALAQRTPGRSGYSVTYEMDTGGRMGCNYSIIALYSDQNILLETPRSMRSCRSLIEL